MFGALNIAATGMHAIENAIDVTANNIANQSAEAYKKSVPHFGELRYRENQVAMSTLILR